MVTETVETLEDLNKVALAVLSGVMESEHASVIALRGDLGAGKTAFVKELGKILGVEGEITSPTFVIMRSYPIAHSKFTTLTHIDAYRIESDDEMRVLNFEELRNDPSQIVCIEWPEKIQNRIPEDAYPVTIEIQKEEIRTVTYGN